MELHQFNFNIKERLKDLVIFGKEKRHKKTTRTIHQLHQFSFIEFVVEANQYISDVEKMIEVNQKDAFKAIVALCDYCLNLPYEQSPDFIYGKIYVLLDRLIQKNNDGVNDQILDWIIDHYANYPYIDLRDLVIKHYTDPIYYATKTRLEL